MYKLASLFLLLAFGPAIAQQAPKPYGPIPAQRQLKWQETEMYCLIHFGPDTYTDKEWGYGDEDEKLFNPEHFDAKQIVGAAKTGGFKGIVVVAKHHDGFCLWPTKTTVHNISKSPYKNGKGDIVMEFKQACDELHMKLGIYCSPWDRNSPLYGKPEYVTDVYRKQLEELYTHYGPLFITWFDGANGGDGYYGGAKETRKIDRSTYYGWDTTWNIVRRLQPGAVIFGDVGPDVRWVGNENGTAGQTSWATYTPHAPEEGKAPGNGFTKDKEGIEGQRDGKYWMPAECDVPLRPGWFYHQYKEDKNAWIKKEPFDPDDFAKTPEQILDIYYASVGRGACLDLGIAPTKEGLLDKHDVFSLKTFGEIRRKTFEKNLAANAVFTASNVRGNNESKYGPQFLVDSDRYSYWATDDKETEPELIVTLTKPSDFNVIQLRENIKLGQRIEGVAIDAFIDGKWKEITTATSIGANRIIKLTKDVITDKVRLRITKSPVCIALSDFGLYKQYIDLSIDSAIRNIIPGE